MKPINFKYVGNGTYAREKNGRFATIKSKFFAALRLIRKAVLFSGVGYAVFMAGAYLYSTETVTANTQVVTLETAAPVLDRIADCESGNGKPGSATQFKNGQVLIALNTNGTYDQGKYQINSIHNAEAAKLGFNLSTEEGNTGFAKWMYANLGTGDWASSQHCWHR